MGSLFFGKNINRQMLELIKIKSHFEQELDSARSKIDTKLLPKMEKMTRKQIEKKVLDLKKNLAKGKNQPKSPDIDDLNSALEIIGLRGYIGMLDRRIKELEREKAA